MGLNNHFSCKKAYFIVREGFSTQRYVKPNVRCNKPSVRLSYFLVVRNNSQVAYSPKK